MKKKLLVLSLMCMSMLAFLTGCETYSYNTSTLRTAETKNTYVSVPLVIEYDTILNQQVTDTSTFRAGGEDGVTNYEALKQWAVINCSKKYGYDVLVNPSYQITNQNGTITIIVSGMPAKYRIIRQATENDLWMLRFFE